MNKTCLSPVVEFTNNWETERYFINGNEITPENCKFIHIQWPDRSEEDVQVKWKDVSGTYIDMGRECSFLRKEMFITINHNGIEIILNLKEILEFKCKYR